jgi:signal transduction histidine kinase
MLLEGDFGDLGEKQKVYLDKLFSLNQRMVELVDDLLNVSRLELGVLESAAEPVDVTEIVQSEAKQIQPLAEAKRVQINEQYVDEIPTMLLAPKLLRLVMQNLLSNAIKYTPEHGLITVRIVRENDPELGDAALISVADTGVGIPKEQQASIFSKFFRAENVREKEIAGTGLGLFIVHNIITLFKGKVWFESIQDRGTTFFVRLPIKKFK